MANLLPHLHQSQPSHQNEVFCPRRTTFTTHICKNCSTRLHKFFYETPQVFLRLIHNSVWRMYLLIRCMIVNSAIQARNETNELCGLMDQRCGIWNHIPYGKQGLGTIRAVSWIRDAHVGRRTLVNPRNTWLAHTFVCSSLGYPLFL